MKKINDVEEIGINTESRMLVFMPHPDDETAFCGIFLHRLSKKGITLRVVTMTKGEASTNRYGCSQEDHLSDVREKELGSAYKLLGVKNFDIRSIPDGGIREHKEEVVKIVRKECADVKPSYVLILEPDGAYGHPDHIYLTKYVREVLPEGIQLIYCTVAKGFKASRGARALAAKSYIEPMEGTHYIQLSPSEIMMKMKAFRCHASQFPLIVPFLNIGYLFVLFQKRMLLREYFVMVGKPR